MEDQIIAGLFSNIPYARKVLPFLQPKFFESAENRLILEVFQAYSKQYDGFPTYSVVKVALIKNTRLSENVVKETFDAVERFENAPDELFDPEWLFDQAELHCKQTAIESAVIKSASIIDDPDVANEEIEQLVRSALQVGFNTDLGIDIFSKIDMKECYDYYVSTENKIECHLKDLNEVFYILRKTATCFLAPPHGGKTAFCCSASIGYVKNGYNVLYISGEMQEKEIAKILYANLMNIPRNDMISTPEEHFMGHHKSFQLKSASWGKYRVKEFPPSTVSMSAIESYIHEVELKLGFKFDVIMLDYLNLFLPIASANSDNTYTSVKRTAEEFRAVCVRNDLAGVTATQTNKEGAKMADFDMTSTSESFGVPATMDAMIALIGTEDLKAQNLMIWKILKNRFTGIINYKKPARTQFEFGRIIDLDEGDDIDVGIDISNSPAAENMANKMIAKKFDSGIKITLDIDDRNDLDDLLIK